MKNYGYSEFVKEKFYPELQKFFEELFNEEKKNDGSVILFVSRKAYCLFLLMKKKKIISSEGYCIYSDRYVMKNIDTALFEGKTVYLVDDTVSTGRHIRDICEMLKKRTSYEKIILQIFMKEYGFSQKAENEIRTEYKAEFFCQCVKPRDEVLYFCSAETYVIHEAGIPYIVELPVLGESEKNETIKLTLEEFEKLKAGNQKWTYYDCSQSGIEQSDITDGVMILKNHFFKTTLSHFVFEFTVKIQSVSDEDTVEVVFVPFAILKSIKFDTLWKIFYCMYEQTVYGKQIIAFKERCKTQEQFAETVYVAVYRAVVYNLSRYIGILFKEYYEEILEERKLQFYEANHKYNFTPEFLDSTKEIFEKRYQNYLFNLMQQSVQEQVNRTEDVFQDVQSYEMLTCSYEAIYLYILAIINELRNNDVGEERQNSKPNAGRYQWSKFITIEEMVDVVYRQYPDENYDTINILMTRCFIALLGQSKLANELYYIDGNIFRGFKYGENSGTTLSLAEKIFYVAVSMYYHRCTDEEMYVRNYDKFLTYLKMFLMNYRLFETVVSRDEFYIYSKFFAKDSMKDGCGEDLKEFIEERRFLASDEPYYLKNLKEFIDTAEIYD